MTKISKILWQLLNINWHRTFFDRLRHIKLYIIFLWLLIKKQEYKKLKAQIEVDLYCENNRTEEEDKKAIAEDRLMKEEICKKLESEMMSIIVDLTQKGYKMTFVIL